ncbi:hypothetical protein Phum_PHUM551870 [Pediculus humanus corporis]|uniref:Uncharacterized protein n=1 Tax=Pediculus humanus subsp. corporis TaxID=121224 RepID=E0W0G1_PEDHC|nr:uncharacterized protein Phum_PHUM551870 [Pediculus humanus corporis]EEB19117.1 hypothetical protein Phum_PHUM551870 [Pediculus humanus corporis]
MADIVSPMVSASFVRQGNETARIEFHTHTKKQTHGLYSNMTRIFGEEKKVEIIDMDDGHIKRPRTLLTQ